MRLIPFACILVLGEILNLGCDAGPVELAGPQDMPSVTEVPFDVSFRSTSARAAVIIRNSGCGLFNGDGEIVSADRDFIVATQSTRQKTTLICKVKNVANSTGRAIRYTSESNPFFPGLACGVARPDDFVSTTAWTETVSASGNATLRCHFKL